MRLTEIYEWIHECTQENGSAYFEWDSVNCKPFNQADKNRVYKMYDDSRIIIKNYYSYRNAKRSALILVCNCRRCIRKIEVSA
jgi:hypothetical protein